MTNAIVWFRQDLRLGDNPALTYALSYHQHVFPLFINEDVGNSGLKLGQAAASHVWLHHSLQKLDASLQKHGSRLHLADGNPLDALLALCHELQIDAVYWNRRYDPVSRVNDSHIKAKLKNAGIQVISFKANVLFEPWEILKADGSPYRVFTAFWKRANALLTELDLPSEGYPASISTPLVSSLTCVTLDQLGFLPKHGWAERMMPSWQVGEEAASQKLELFMGGNISGYQANRDFPVNDMGVSQLSPHLHFGEISVFQIVRLARQMLSENPQFSSDSEAFIRQIIWREFAIYLLFYFPETLNKALLPQFEKFRWNDNFTQHESDWQKGLTGYPIIDAGMRQLWHTGWMHNRVRMIVASFLTKNLLIPWQHGEKWFRDTLLDADLANNVMGWQWVAGSGADAAPYFRIFNPVLQSQKFDPQGEYIRRWLPELENRQAKKVHLPLQPEETFDYPSPIVDLKVTRERALRRYAEIKKG